MSFKVKVDNIYIMDYTQLNKEDLINIIETLQKNSTDTSRDIFISNISHDVRTLLNAIYGHAQILANDPTINEAQKQSINKILDSSGHMIDLINDIINISKNVGNEQLSLVQFNLNRFLNNLYHVFESNIDKNSVKFVLNNEVDDNFEIKTDKNKLFYILLNLVGNSVKFTKKGLIEIHCKPVSNKSVLFEVIDTGIGIDQTSLKKIFEAYEKSENNDFLSGNGLGLSIAKKNVSLLGGTLEVESEVSKGSRFYFSIKCENLKQEFLSIKKDIFELKQIKSLKENQEFFVLIGEEDDTQKSILQNYLLSKMIPFKIVASLKQAEEYLQNNRVDMMFLDTNLGLQECKKFVSKIRDNNLKIPIIAITASVMSDELRKINEVFTNYIISPYNFLDIDQSLILFSNKQFEFIEEENKENNDKFDFLIESSLKADIIDYANLGHYDKLKDLIKKVSHSKTKELLKELLQNYDFESIVERVGE